MRHLKTFVMSLLAATLSCQSQDCKNDDPVFDHPELQKPEYQAAVLDRIGNGDNYTFTLTGYEERAGVPYLLVDITGKNLCAKAEVAVKKDRDEKVRNIIKTKGMGYHGAELKGLKLTLYVSPEITYLTYKSMERIID